MQRLNRFRLLVVLLAYTTAAWALNPERATTQYIRRTWRRDGGLPVNTVNAITFTQDGRLWLGTSQGLISFDGSEFRSLSEAESAKIGDRVVTTLAPRAGGGLWYGLDNGGYGYFDGETTHMVKLPPWMSAEPVVHQVHEARDGYLYVTSTSGIGRARNAGMLESVLQNTRIDIASIYEDPKGKIWIGTVEQGIYTWDNGKLASFPDASLKHNIVEVMAHDQQGNLWVATPKGVIKYDAELHAEVIPLESFSPKCLLVDSHNTIWIGTFGGGVFRYQNGHLSRFNTLEGLASDDVLSIAESRDGSLWIGTSDGLTQLSDLKFPMISRTEGLVYDGALCVAASPFGGVWVGTPNGLSYYKDGESANYGVNCANGFSSNWIKRIYPAKNGDVYMIGGQKSLDLFSNGRVVQTWQNDEWPKDVVEDSRGVIVAVAGKLMRIENGRFIPYHLADGTTVNLGWINNLLSAEDGTLWISDNTGLFAIKDGVLIDYCKTNGLPKVRYTFLAADSAGYIWAAQHHGIARCKEGKMSVITRDQGLYQNYVYAIVADSLGNFWMDSGRGIFRVPQAELNAVADGKASSLHCKVYEGADAVKSTDKVAIEYAGARSTDGKVWFPTSKGVVMIDPANIPENPPLSCVSIFGMRVDGKAYHPDKPVLLEPGSGNLEFDYVAIEYIAPKKVQYRYRLEGLDKDWVLAGNRRAAYYTNVPAGHYRFEVQASNTDGVWNKSDASIAFDLPRRYYQTTAFRVACLLLLMGTAAYAAWVRRVHRSKKELEKANTLMEEKVTERTAELTAEIEVRKRAQEETERLHDELRASAEAAKAAVTAKSQFLANMSHEIRTPMNAIVGMSCLLLDTPLNSHQLELVETTHNSSEALLSILNDILDFSKIEVGKMTFESLDFDLTDAVEESLDLLAVRAAEKKVALAAIIAHDLPLMVRGDPSRLRQVLLNLLGNAVKFTEHGSIFVTVKRDPAVTGDRVGVRFEIRDSGIGISAETQKQLFKPFTQADSSTTRRFGGTGLGLAISHQIVTLMGGTIGVASVPGEGSTFWFSVPLHPAEAPGTTSPAGSCPRSISGLRILLLNTTPVLQQVLRHHAEAWGVQLCSAASHEEATRLASEAEKAEEPFCAVIVQQNGALSLRGADLPVIQTNLVPLQTVLVTSRQLARASNPGIPGVVAILPEPIRMGRFRRALETIAGSAPAYLKSTKAKKTYARVSPEPPPSRRALRILVAEDNSVNQRVIQLQLRKAGCEAKIVANGIEALKELENNSYDLVLMDCQMPEMDGYEATRRLRQQERTKDLYIVAMTANALDGDRERCFAAGMNAYLSKPIRERDLIEALESVPVNTGKTTA